VKCSNASLATSIQISVIRPAQASGRSAAVVLTNIANSFTPQAETIDLNAD